MPAPVRRRVTGLKGIQKDHSKLEAEFQEEVLQLEKKYFAKFTPLYEKRAKIVNGQSEPTDAEIEAGKSEDEDEEGAPKPEEQDEAESTEAAAGIPEFWLSAMKNQISLAELITDRDEEALRNLTDVRMEYLDKPGFRLIFQFAENDFFSNKTITKTYFYREENGYGGDFIYDHAEGDKIEWKAGKDLTVRVESKKQRNKSKSIRDERPSMLTREDTKQTRVVKKTVPTESFFNFFSPPAAPDDDDDDEDASSDIEERLELDYQLGKNSRSATAYEFTDLSQVRTSKKSSFRVPSTGSLARPCSLRSTRKMATRGSLMTRMTMRKSLTTARLNLTMTMQRMEASLGRNRTPRSARTSRRLSRSVMRPKLLRGRAHRSDNID